MSGSFVLVLHTHLPYVIRHGRWPHGVEWLCEAAAECYIPLLNEWFALRAEGIDPGVTMSISPVLLEQLADDEFPSILQQYLEERIDAAERDMSLFAGRDEDRRLIPVARFWRSWYRDRLHDFIERYDRDLVGAMRDLRDAGSIALQTCGATHGYFPLLGRDESIHAQIQVAVDTHTRHFRQRPLGIWMPECAYRPSGWRGPAVPSEDVGEGFRVGVEQLIAAGGIDHTVVDAHTVRAGQPVNWYLSRFLGGPSGDPGERFIPLNDPRSVYEHYKIHSEADPAYGGVAAFARDVETALRVWSGESGYPGEPAYLEFHKKHHNSGHRYWRVTGRDVELGHKDVYDPEATEARLEAHAEDFVRLIETQLAAYGALTGREGSMCLPFDTELFGHWWFEGPRFLGKVIRRLAKGSPVRSRTMVQEVSVKGMGRSVTLPEGSWGEAGDHRVWLNEQTAWTWPEIYRAERECIELIRTRDRSSLLEERVLKQLARELLLMQSSDWQFLITTGTAVDYAEERFRDHRDSVSLLSGYVRSLRAGTDRLDSFEELCRLESRDRLFPDLNLDYWSWHHASEALMAPKEGE